MKRVNENENPSIVLSRRDVAKTLRYEIHKTCCESMLELLTWSNKSSGRLYIDFLKTKRINYGSNSLPPHLEFNYCPFCGEELQYTVIS